jgi:FKBP-type peptidyl-prolyl cis-trans isomerase
MKLRVEITYFLLAIACLIGPVGCRTTGMVQEEAAEPVIMLPEEDDEVLAQAMDFQTASVEVVEAELSKPDRWKISGGFVDAAIENDSAIKPVPLIEEEYWVKNAERSGMVVMDSGVQCLPVRKGRGLPIANAPKVRVNYLASRITGERIADSRLKDEGRPLEMVVADMPRSWQEVIPRMKIGDICRVFVPAELLDDLDLPSGSYSFDIEMVKAFADVSDWYTESSVDIVSY